MPVVSPVNVLTKLPVPALSRVLSSDIVGVLIVLQHTPLDNTVSPPSLVTVPPLDAVVCVIKDACALSYSRVR